MLLRSFVFCLLTTSAALAAPAPFPRSGDNAAEVVFEARTAERARLAAIYLRSKFMIEAIGERGREWSECRAQIEVCGTKVRVRLGSPHRVPFLQKLADTLTRKGEVEGRLSVKEKIFVERGWERAARLRVEFVEKKVSKEEVQDMEETLGWVEFRREHLKVHQEPRRVRVGR